MSLKRFWTQQVTSLAFTPDGKILAVQSGLGYTRLWDVATRKETWSRDARRSIALTPATSALSPDGKTLASGTTVRHFLREFGELKLRDQSTGTERLLSRLPFGPLTCVEFTPDGKTLVVAGKATRTTKLQLWDTATGEERLTLMDVASFAAFSPNGKILVTGILDSSNTATLWDVATGRTLATLPGSSPTFSPDGKTLALRYGEGVRLWNVTAISENPTNPKDP